MQQQTSLEKTRLFIVDDSLTYRSILSSVIKSIPGVELFGSAKNGRDALTQVRQAPPDMVFLDVEMPIMNGIETMQALLQDYPSMGIVLISGANKSNADMTIQALQGGALDFIAKPDYDSMEKNMATLKDRITSTITIYNKNHVTMKHTPPAPKVESPVKPVTPTHRRQTFEAITIGISTGGPNALNELIPRLPANLGVPVLIVQHMPPIFTASLAASLDKKSNLRVKEAEHGETVEPNVVYIAPGGQHMTVQKDSSIAVSKAKIVLNEDPPENSCRPAVDVLFRSAAKVYKQNALAIIMTGMGADGAKGVQEIKAQGGYCLTQSAQSCVVYGMPRAVDDLNLSDEKIPLDALSERITLLLSRT